MNKKIAELSEQAFAPINDIASEGIADRYTFNQAWFKLYSQNLAELIISECANIVNSLEQHEGPGDCATSEYIKEHFQI